MKMFIYKNLDGKAVVIYPMQTMYDPNSRERQALADQNIILKSDDEVDAYLAKQTIPEGMPYRVGDSSELPEDRYFRDAWTTNDDQGLVVNMSMAKEIHLANIRKWRDQELAALDVPALQAMEVGDTDALATIVAQKQTLRDIPQTINLDVASSPEALKEILPEGMTL